MLLFADFAEPLSGPRILPQNSSSNQRTSSADSSSKALLNMLYNPPEYQAAETGESSENIFWVVLHRVSVDLYSVPTEVVSVSESVKDFSESSSSEVISPSTATGISRIACGQVSAGKEAHLSLSLNWPKYPFRAGMMLGRQTRPDVLAKWRTSPVLLAETMRHLINILGV